MACFVTTIFDSWFIQLIEVVVGYVELIVIVAEKTGVP